MTTQRLAYIDPNTNILCLVSPAPDWMNQSSDNTLDALAALVIPKDTQYSIIDITDLPHDEKGNIDRSKRNGWVIDHNTKAVSIDDAMATANAPQAFSPK